MRGAARPAQPFGDRHAESGERRIGGSGSHEFHVLADSGEDAIAFLMAAMEQHVNEYEVDIMNMQRAEKLIPAEQTGGLHEVRLANGGSLKARTVILSTGARWRQMSVPGDEEYRNKGVAYCPHCDGPLFKGKSVAVIGGGNSGIEAALDLAGIVKSVTVYEFLPELKADVALVERVVADGPA